MRRPLRVLGLTLAVLVVPLLSTELVFRLRTPELAASALERFRQHLLTGEMREYEPRAHTVFQRPRSGPASNSYGFLDGPWSAARTPGVPRILCLGGSTTEGGNKTPKGSYPSLLERVLEERSGRDVEVYNAGISGWTSAEMLVSWFLTLSDLAPDVLVMHEVVNDLEPRFRADFVPDYSHWRRPIQLTRVQGLERTLVRWSDFYVYLRLKGGKAPDIVTASTVPDGPREPLMDEGKLPHATSLPFRRNIASIALSAHAAGTRVVLMTLPTGPAEVGEFWRYGIAEHNQHLRELCTEHGFLLVDAARAFEERPEMAAEFLDLVHVQPPANQLKAELVAEALEGWLAGLGTDGARPPAAQESR